MDAVVLCAGLEHDAFGLDGCKRESFTEVLEECDFVLSVIAVADSMCSLELDVLTYH